MGKMKLRRDAKIKRKKKRKNEINTVTLLMIKNKLKLLSYIMFHNLYIYIYTRPGSIIILFMSRDCAG